MQILPSSYISSYIKHYLFLEVESNSIKKFRHFSNGLSGIVFTIRKDDFRILDCKTALPDTYVFGQISKGQDFIADGTLAVIIVLFHPYGLYRFTGIPSKEFQDNVFDSSLIFGNEILRLNDRLKSVFNINEMVESLNCFFIEKLKTSKYSIKPFLQSTVQQVFDTKGTVSVNQLCIHAGCNERKLQRVFSQQIGMAPKSFILSVKLHSFLGLMSKESCSGFLTRLSLQAGFYDQAHLIREFKRITGVTPSRYKTAPSLAVNLIELQ